MNMKKMTQEQISAFADAELADHEIAGVLFDLRLPERREAWDIYHQIGDVLRSEDLAYEMRPQMQKRMAVLLAAEPVVFAPVLSGGRTRKLANDFEQLSVEQTRAGFMRTAKHFFRPGFTVAATAAAVAFFAAPPMMVAFNGWRADGVFLANSVSPVMAVVDKGNINLNAAGAVTKDNVAIVADIGSSGVMRDSNMDEYLIAHQRFSRSGYGNGQYASPASFTTESTK